MKKMNLKKILSLTAAFALTLSLAACSGGNDSGADSKTTPDTTPSNTAEDTQKPDEPAGGATYKVGHWRGEGRDL